MRAYESTGATFTGAAPLGDDDRDPVLSALCGLVGASPDASPDAGNSRLRRVLQIVGARPSRDDEDTRGNPPAIEPLIAIAARRLVSCITNQDVMIFEDVPEIVGFSVFQLEDWATRDEAFREIFERVRDALVSRMFRATLGSELHPSIGLRALSSTSRRWNERTAPQSNDENGSRSNTQRRRGVVEVHIPALAAVEDTQG